MSESPRSESLLDQLDSLQNQVLSDLDTLDERILGLIRQCTQSVSIDPETVPVEVADAA